MPEECDSITGMTENQVTKEPDYIEVLNAME